MSIVRFAPSPTGFVHIGSLRTALYNYLYAKKTGGKYILRVEDTDQTRLVEGALEGMLKAMNWSGIVHTEGVILSEGNKIIQIGEEGPYIQSERLDIYKNHIKALIDNGDAYYCFCSKDRLDKVREIQKSKNEDPKYDGHCKKLTKEEIEAKINAGEPYVIRLKLPDNYDISFKDIVRGDVTINTKDMDDQVLMKADGFPTYHFAVVVDDHLMGVTHVIRGEEWLTSTPKHVYLYKVLNWNAPTFVHLPNILNADKKKLSKRQGDVAVEDFKNKGYLPEALVNYVALLGWSPDSNKEIFSMKELEEEFNIERVSKSGGVFDVAKLNWMNNQYIKGYDLEALTKLSLSFVIDSGIMNKEEANKNFNWLCFAMDTVRESMDYLSEFPEKIRKFTLDRIENIETEAMEFMELDHMKTLKEALVEKINERQEITADEFSKILKEIQTEYGIKGKNLFMGSRVLISGENHGPDLPKMCQLIGKERLLSRIGG
ncbi:MAG: glutamate--tRNA ligase [Filifactoraceae bacterium]